MLALVLLVTGSKKVGVKKWNDLQKYCHDFRVTVGRVGIRNLIY
jgi:hypothetical protein